MRARKRRWSWLAGIELDRAQSIKRRQIESRERKGRSETGESAKRKEESGKRIGNSRTKRRVAGREIVTWRGETSQIKEAVTVNS